MRCLGEVLRELMPRTAAWTDREWQLHDQAVREELERDRAIERAELLSRQREILLSQGCPAKFLDLGLAETSAVVQLAHALVGHGGRIVVLAGPPGTGKTTAAIGWLRSTTQKPWWCTAPGFARQSRYQEPPWLAAKVAVLDDLGIEYLDKGGSFATDLDELVSHYHAAQKRLVLTTNLKPDEFRSRYGERIRSRLREAGAYIALNGDDMRTPSQ